MDGVPFRLNSSFYHFSLSFFFFFFKFIFRASVSKEKFHMHFFFFFWKLRGIFLLSFLFQIYPKNEIGSTMRISHRRESLYKRGRDASSCTRSINFRNTTTDRIAEDNHIVRTQTATTRLILVRFLLFFFIFYAIIFFQCLVLLKRQTRSNPKPLFDYASCLFYFFFLFFFFYFLFKSKVSREHSYIILKLS